MFRPSAPNSAGGEGALVEAKRDEASQSGELNRNIDCLEERAVTTDRRDILVDLMRELRGAMETWLPPRMQWMILPT